MDDRLVIMRTSVACPYCGVTNYINVKGFVQQVLVSCDVDDSNGCGRDFVVKTILNAENKVRPLFDELKGH